MFSNRSNAELSNSNVVTFSIIIPTYNESENILRLISEIEKNLPTSEFTEIVIVDDNSPDGTGKLVENYINQQDNKHQKQDQGKDCKLQGKNSSSNWKKWTNTRNYGWSQTVQR